jgi:hypothetical protein
MKPKNRYRQLKKRALQLGWGAGLLSAIGRQYIGTGAAPGFPEQNGDENNIFKLTAQYCKLCQ